MVTQLFLGTAIVAAAIGTAAAASATQGSPFSELCMASHCSTPAPGTVRHIDVSQVQAGIQQGMQFALSPGR
jgi:hypothetical protein